MEWKRTLFLVTFGVFVGASIISWCHRHLQARVLGEEIMQDGRCTIQQSRRFRIGMITSCGLCGIGFLVYSGFMYAARLEISGEYLRAMGGDNFFSTIFVGSANVFGYEILNPVADGEEWCMEDSIMVNVSVAWGGSWGCPSSPDTYCETVVESKVGCLFADLFKENYEGFYGDDDQDFDENSYVNHRYHFHSSSHADDDAYDPDPYAFDYDKDTDPGSTFMYFSSQSEQIFGSCETCEARSMVWVREMLMSMTRATHRLALSFGLGLCLLVWSIYEGVTNSKTTTSIEQTENNDAVVSMVVLEDSGTTAS